MSADTVHRQEEKTTVNPALAAIFESTVIFPIAEARHFMDMDPPRARDAMVKLLGAGEGITALELSYRDSDPVLAANLAAAGNLRINMTNMLGSLVGESTTNQAFSANFRVLERQIDQIAPKLH
jgi:hypothetical protein